MNIGIPPCDLRKGTVMMQLTVHADSLAVLFLQGKLDRSHADELRAFLRRSLDCVNRLIVSSEQVTGVDDACLKVLCNAYRMSQTLHKEFTLAGHPRAGQISSREHCGGCGLKDGQGCIWGAM